MEIESLVEQILSLNTPNPFTTGEFDVDTSDIEQQIDRLVYKLYNLNKKDHA